MNNELQQLYDLLYWQASELAQAKRYSEAEMLLANFEQADAAFKAKAYDLQARMLIQQKQYVHALSPSSRKQLRSIQKIHNPEPYWSICPL